MTYLPGNSKLLVHRLRSKETIYVLLQALLKIIFQDDIFPVGLLNFRPKTVIFGPKTLVEHPNFIMQLLASDTSGENKISCGVFGPFVQYKILEIEVEASLPLLNCELKYEND